MRIVDVYIYELNLKPINIGFVGENEHTRIVFHCMSVFAQYPNAVPAVVVSPPEGDAYPAVVRREYDDVIWDITDSDLITSGSGEIQVTFTENNVVAKSCKGTIEIGDSIEPTGEVPTPIENWLVEANTALNAIPQTIDYALTEAKASGEFDGQDGFSPTILSTAIQNGHRLTIVDITGESNIDVLNGNDGYTPIKGVDYFDGEKGDTGPRGPEGQAGYTPVKGVDYFDGAKGDPGYTPVKGVDYFDGEDGHTPVKGVDYFDGADGYTPVKGVDYFDGEDGYTPVKGVDYFDGAKGDPGYTPIKGVDYFDGAKGDPGKDGYTPVKGVDYFDGAKGDPGNDGYTPVKGVDYFDGQDGFSPTVSVEEISGGHQVSITDSVETKTFDVMDGATGPVGIGIPDGGTTGQVLKKHSNTDYDTEWANDNNSVEDVRIDSSSIVTNGIANIPKATYQNAGVVKTSTDYGTNMRDAPYDDTIMLVKASSDNIKSGNSQYKPVVPYNQHESVFYGLAKAAGDNTQASSSNNVGVFTDDAKIAIQKMLGIYQPPYELITYFTLSERSNVLITEDSNGQPFRLRNVIMEIFYPENLTAESAGYGRYYFMDNVNNPVRLYAETGRYASNTQSSFKIISVQRIANMSYLNFTRQVNTGSYGTWVTKSITYQNYRSMSLDFGDITRIELNASDYEPAGTRISVWGQRAY